VAELTTSPRRSASEAQTRRRRSPTASAPPSGWLRRLTSTSGAPAPRPRTWRIWVVTGLVLEEGGNGDEDQAIAAMLHDSVEDGGGRPMLERTARRPARGSRRSSDTVDGHPTGRWIESKRRYLRHLATVDDDAILPVALADKVHNARSIVRDCRREGHALCACRSRRLGKNASGGADEVVIGRHHHVDRTGPMNPA
jgi:hypothetical protein